MAILTKVILLLIGSEQDVYFLIQMRVINKEEEKYGQKFKSESSEKGGRKALAEYNRMNRGPIVQMNTGTRVHTDQRKKKPKHKNRMFE